MADPALVAKLLAHRQRKRAKSVDFGRVFCEGFTKGALRVRLEENEGRVIWVPLSVISAKSEVRSYPQEGHLFVFEWWAEAQYAEWDRRDELSRLAHEQAQGRPAIVAHGASMSGQRLLKRQKSVRG